MEKVLKDLLNTGIAIFRVGEENLSKALADLQASYAELKTKGESDRSEKAEQLRKLLDDIISQAKNLNSKVDVQYGEAAAKLETIYKSIDEQIKKFTSDDTYKSLKSKLEELAAAIREKSAKKSDPNSSNDNPGTGV